MNEIQIDFDAVKQAFLRQIAELSERLALAEAGQQALAAELKKLQQPEAGE